MRIYETWIEKTSCPSSIWFELVLLIPPGLYHTTTGDWDCFWSNKNYWKYCLVYLFSIIHSRTCTQSKCTLNSSSCVVMWLKMRRPAITKCNCSVRNKKYLNAVDFFTVCFFTLENIFESPGQYIKHKICLIKRAWKCLTKYFIFKFFKNVFHKNLPMSLDCWPSVFSCSSHQLITSECKKTKEDTSNPPTPFL